jgi:hypothetical protein
MIGAIDPLKLDALIQMGAFMGIAIWPILLSWRYYGSILKAAIGRRTMTPEEEASEPIHYRWILLIFIVSFIILTAQLVASGLHVQGSVFFWITVVLVSLAYARIHGEGGPHPEWGWAQAGWLYQPFFSGMSWKTMNQEYYVMGTMGWFLGRPTLGLWSGHADYGMNAFKLGFALNVSSRRIFIAGAIAAIIGIIIAWPMAIWMRYYYGAFGLPGMSNAYWWGAGGYTNPEWAAVTPQPPFYGQVVAGFLIVGALLFLRMRFVWWPLVPVGFVLGVGNPQGFWGFASAALWGWILKTLTFRIGGARVYERYGMPFATGIMGGIALNSFVSYLLGVLKVAAIV